MNEQHQPGTLRLQFPDNFLWGCATASYQVEGAVEADGRGASIWDTFSHTPGKTLHGHTGDVTCDHYHRYPEDIELMKRLGAGAYRFSLAWPRIQPTGSGSVNRAGIEHYRRLCGSLRDAGMKPVVTLYHWDLPQALQDAGGWPARDTAARFAEYADLCFRELGDLVDRWITLNEPYCTSILGYLVGVHAPGIKERPLAYRAIHHLNLAHGYAVQAYRALGLQAPIGTALNLVTPRPATRSAEDVLAADLAMDLQTRMFLDPLLGRDYPARHLALYPEVEMPVQSGDMEIIKEPIDFLGLNYYFEDAVCADESKREGYRQVRQYQPVTAMGWHVVPRGLYRHLKKVAEMAPGIELYITENGAAFHDHLDDEGRKCHDPQRIAYLKEHFAACVDAIADGVPLAGYFAWSLIDNFEWSFGFERRFGLVYCDYVDGRRVPKDSFFFYRDVIAGHEA